MAVSGSMAAVTSSKRQKTIVQTEAANKVLKHFKRKSRALVTMACGAGKTRVGFMVIVGLKKKISIIAVPSLGLVKQMRDDASEWPELSSYETLLVCSSIRRGDAYESPEDYGLQVTTSPEVILDSMMKASARKKLMIVVTYQSYKKISEAVKLGKSCRKKVEIGLLVADESHNTAGHVDKNMAVCLSDKQMKVTKRLFLTATPRVVSDRIKNTDEFNCMDDDSVYGKNVYSLSFAEAIKRGITCDYEIRNMEVNWKGEDAEKLNTKEFQKSKSRIDALADYMARRMKKRPGMRVFSFHTECKNAEAFNAALQKCKVWSRCITGEMPVNEREEILKEFASNGKSRVICSVRVFGEGVDVPSVDTVVFTDPLTSEIQIAQMVGRGQRIEEGKSLLSVYLPIFHPRGTDRQGAEETAKCSFFKTAVKVLRTMSSMDERVVGQIRNLSGTGVANGLELDRSIFNQDDMSPEFAKVVNSIVIQKMPMWEPSNIGEFIDRLKNEIDVRPMWGKSVLFGRSIQAWSRWLKNRFNVSTEDVFDAVWTDEYKSLQSINECVLFLRSKHETHPVCRDKQSLVAGKTIGAWQHFCKRKYNKSMGFVFDLAWPERVFPTPETVAKAISVIRSEHDSRPIGESRILGRTRDAAKRYVSEKFGITLGELLDKAFHNSSRWCPESLTDLVDRVRQEITEYDGEKLMCLSVAGKTMSAWKQWLSHNSSVGSWKQLIDMAFRCPTSIEEMACWFRNEHKVKPSKFQGLLVRKAHLGYWRHVADTMFPEVEWAEFMEMVWPCDVDISQASLKFVVTRLRKDHKLRPSFGEAPCGLTADKWEAIAKRLNTTVAAIMDEAFSNQTSGRKA